MQILPVDKIQIDFQKTIEIKKIVESTLRLITFSRKHLADDLLNSYIEQTTSLKELVSIRNAQLEAETEEEIEIYANLLKVAMNFISDEILADICFNSEVQLFQLFRLISPDSHAKHPNKYRTQDVQIGRYVCPDASEVPSRVSELFFSMNQISNPVIRAIYFHHELIRIHPFVDGNGRTTRMAKNWILLYELYPPIFISKENEKKTYVETLENSFLQLNQKPNQWNSYLELFFDQEIDRLLRSATEIHDKVTQIGKIRLKK